MLAIYIKSINTVIGVHETDGNDGDIVSIYSGLDGSLIENCIIFKCESY